MPFIDHEASGSRYHSTRINLRWSDFDQFQHVNNAAYLEFSQDARIDFVRDVLTEMDISVPAFIVRWASVDYRKPLSSSDTQVLIESFMYEIGEKSFKMRQYIRNGQHRIVAVVDTVNVAVDILSGKSRPWTDSDREVINMFMIPVEDDREEDSLAVQARKDTEFETGI
ncbi:MULTISPECIES: acyl-CoA thioesterase [Corynebacterium]|jgi:acyl-CoA thioester hydrolase|uniref:Long-chain acyl-CoA thioesterase FadM n=1 Tax=Corynebacterium provencense TaxID=1737425 RepID=A0A2Z3YN95_9CORY|nr:MULTISPECIES: thioesterase family protein [Corynebacterium]AWT26705.1 Long-chain acyl-CoA thioesterase FadM [Corynebacterium provencense]MCI1256786.1 acyl-CoA thioesterase [Corynebacterium provencense]